MPRRRRYRPNVPFLCAVGAFVLAIALYIGVGVLSAALTPRRLGMPAGLMLPLVARTLDAISAVWFFAVGASIGSFLNVVAYRLPRGKTLLGNSACPFCCTPIAAADNIPVFAWLRLRGRCRTCHLPISIEYPLIELMVGLAFLVVYSTEFAVAGSNLPGASIRPVGSGLVWMSVTPLLATRTFVYLWVLGGLIAAALIAARRIETPLSLFGWIMAVLVIAELVRPAAVVVPWWAPLPGGASSDPATSVAAVSLSAQTQVDALLTIGLGSLAGLIAAALTLPLLQRATSHIAWYGTLACVGALVGWQWITALTACVLLVTACGNAVLRGVLRGWSWSGTSADPVIWTWLGLLIFRANWYWLNGLLLRVQAPTSWLLMGLCFVLALAAAWWVGRAGWAQLPQRQQPDSDARAVASEDADIGVVEEGSETRSACPP